MSWFVRYKSRIQSPSNSLEIAIASLPVTFSLAFVLVGSTESNMSKWFSQCFGVKSFADDENYIHFANASWHDVHFRFRKQKKKTLFSIEKLGKPCKFCHLCKCRAEKGENSEDFEGVVQSLRSIAIPKNKFTHVSFTKMDSFATIELDNNDSVNQRSPSTISQSSRNGNLSGDDFWIPLKRGSEFFIDTRKSRTRHPQRGFIISLSFEMVEQKPGMIWRDSQDKDHYATGKLAKEIHSTRRD